MSKAASRTLNSDLVHRGLEKLAVLADLDRIDVRPDQFDAVFIENSLLVKFDRQIEAGLSADGREQSVRTFFFDDRGSSFECERFYIRPVGYLRVGHYRRRI